MYVAVYWLIVVIINPRMCKFVIVDELIILKTLGFVKLVWVLLG